MRQLVFGTIAIALLGCGGSSSAGPTTQGTDASTTADASTAGDGGTNASEQTFFDSALDVYWLADANFAISTTGKAIQTAQGVTGIAADGTMPYATAIVWVNALNSYHQPDCPSGQVGYLCHDDWQLPVTPPNDSTCTVHAGTQGFSFGPNCKGSALGSLFYGTLGLSFPASVAPAAATFGPFENVRPGLYWTSDPNNGGEETFSFLSNIKFGNTTSYNLFRLLPMSPGAIGSPPSGSGAVRPYVSGPAAGRAVYDSVSGNSWTLDANLAASNAFGVTGSLSVPASGNENAITMPLVASDGSVLFSAVVNWIAGMNAAGGYAGSTTWKLPAYADLETLFVDAGLQRDDVRLLFSGATGPFVDFQSFFYWACPQKAGTKLCDYGANAGTSGGQDMQFAFNFDTGFQGTDLADKRYFTLVYRPNQ